MKVLRRLSGSGFIRDMSTLMCGRVAGQVVLLLTMPLLTRLYTPDQFGLAGVIVAIATSIAAVAAFRMDFALILPRTRAASLNILAFALASAVLVATMSFAGIVILWWMQPEIFGSAGRHAWLFAAFIPLLVVSQSAAETFTQAAMKERAVRSLAVAYALRPIANVTTQGALALSSIGPIGLLSGYLAGPAAFCIFLGWTIRGFFSESGRRLRTRTVRAALSRYRSFVHYNTPFVLCTKIGQHAPIILLGVLFSPAAAGSWFLIKRALSAPTGLFSDTARKSFSIRAAKAYRDGIPLRSMYLKVLGGLALVICPGVLLMMLAGEPLTLLVFGEQWDQAGAFLAVFAVAWGATVLTMPARVLLDVYGRHKVGLKWEILHTMTVAAALFAGAETGNTETAILYLTGVTLVCMSWLIWYGHRLSAHTRVTLPRNGHACFRRTSRSVPVSRSA